MPPPQSLQLNSESAGAARIFIYAFPLLLMDIIRRAHPVAPHQFQIVSESAALAPGLQDDDPRAIVTSAWVDVAHGPVAVRLPPTGGRHYSLTLIDTAGEIFASFGTRTRVDAVENVAVVGPNWHGELPAGLTAKRSPSNRFWAVGRCYAHSALDRKPALAVVRRQAISDVETRIERLDVAQLETPSTPCAQQALDMASDVFFHRLGGVLDGGPPRHTAVTMIETLLEGMGASGVRASWTPEFAAAVEQGVRKGHALLNAAAALAMRSGRGAAVLRLSSASSWGDAQAWAANALRALGAPAPQDLLFLESEFDSDGRMLTGESSYRIRLRGDAMPPARAFWWLYTLPSPAHRHPRGLGDRSDLLVNRDGSVDILVQAAPPADAHQVNWLPTPSGAFSLNIALHWPLPAALSGAWRLPPVELVRDAPRDGAAEGRANDLSKWKSRPWKG